MSHLETLKDSLPDLHSAAVSEKELFEKVIDYTRPLSEYPTAQHIASFLKLDIRPQHIYTETLNAGGRVVQDSMEKYLENEALSSSMLKAALKTPLHFAFARSEDREELEKLIGTPKYFELGTFLHQAILEPTKFNRAIIEPAASLSTTEGVEKLIKFWEAEIEKQGFGFNEKEEQLTAQEVLLLANEDVQKCGLNIEKIDGKRAYLRCLKSFSGLEPVTEENFIKIQILKKHYENYGNGILKRLLHHSKREISMYHTDPITGLDLKVRPDAIQFKENIGVDAIISIKSSGIEDLQAFYHQAAKLHYDLSEGMYQEIATQCTGRDFNTTISVMLQTVAPFAIAILVWSAEDIEMGKHKYRFALENAKEIIEKESVKGYEVFSEEDNLGLIQMSLPVWNQKEYLPVNI